MCKEQVKDCDNCGKYNDCRNGSGLWPCHDHSAWEPKEKEIYDECATCIYNKEV